MCNNISVKAFGPYYHFTLSDGFWDERVVLSTPLVSPALFIYLFIYLSTGLF